MPIPNGFLQQSGDATSKYFMFYVSSQFYKYHLLSVYLGTRSTDLL